MTRRHINIDDEVLEKAKANLGAKTITETVNEALKVVASLLPAVEFEVEWWKTHSIPDLREV